MDNFLDSGIVTNVDNNSVKVKFEQKDDCKACGASVLCNPRKNNNPTLIVQNTQDVSIGDKVALKENGNLLLWLSVYQYGLPLFGFITGILISNFALRKYFNESNELVLFLGGLIGLGIAGFIAWFFIKRIARNSSHYFILEKL